MRKLFVILFSLIVIATYSQDLPSEPSNGFAFSIGTKFTIKLQAVDSLNFDYSIIEFEQFEEVVDLFENDFLFTETGEDNTLTFYFCFGTIGETDEEKEKNMKVILLFKNYSKYALNYSSDILRDEEGEFEYTSNVGSFPEVKSMEMWPYMIYTIGLSEFQRNNEMKK